MDIQRTLRSARYRDNLHTTLVNNSQKWSQPRFFQTKNVVHTYFIPIVLGLSRGTELIESILKGNLSISVSFLIALTKAPGTNEGKGFSFQLMILGRTESCGDGASSPPGGQEAVTLFRGMPQDLFPPARLTFWSFHCPPECHQPAGNQQFTPWACGEHCTFKP